MFPTFHDQDLLMSNLLVTHPNNLTDKFIKPLRRGDVIVFHAPLEQDKLYIKRIVGLPGETVQVTSGHVYLNGALFDESSYLKPEVLTYGEAYMRDGDTITVPDGTFFVMGDNRPNSSDSREWGPLKETAIVGRSMIRFWPMKDFEIIHNPFTGK
jgi:signal peptidase I